MKESDRVNEWVRHYENAHLKFNALRAVYESDPKLLELVLKKLDLKTAADVVRSCDDCWVSRR